VYAARGGITMQVKLQHAINPELDLEILECFCPQMPQ